MDGAWEISLAYVGELERKKTPPMRSIAPRGHRGPPPTAHHSSQAIGVKDKKTRPCDHSHDGATIANLRVPIASTSKLALNQNMLAIVCQAILFDFLENPGFLEKEVRPEILPLPEKTEGRERLVGQMTT